VGPEAADQEGASQPAPLLLVESTVLHCGFSAAAFGVVPDAVIRILRDDRDVIPQVGTSFAVDLYWLPLGAGGHSVRLNGKVFEAIAARLAHRRACDLYHSALVVHVPEGRFVIEQAPVRDALGQQRGVVAEGPIGTRFAGRFRTLRYEVRCWRNGVIPDVDEAVESPKRLSEDDDVGRRLLKLVPMAPVPVWGRDEFGAGEMWNSNSLISWLLARGGVDVELVRPPSGGRAPGWHAGLVVARGGRRPRRFADGRSLSPIAD
jgi:hypothetical protein